MKRAKNRQLQRGSTWADSAARWQQHRGEARSPCSAPRTPEPLKPHVASPPVPSHTERGQTHPQAPCGRDTRPDPALQNRSWLIPKHAWPPAAAAPVGSKGHGCHVLAQTHFLAAPKPHQDRWRGCERPSAAPALGAPTTLRCDVLPGLEPHGSSGGQREDAPAHVSPLTRLHVPSLNPVLPEQSSTGIREAVFPMTPARAGSFTMCVKARQTEGCSQMGRAVPPARVPTSRPKITTPHMKSDLSSRGYLLLSSQQSSGAQDKEPRGLPGPARPNQDVYEQQTALARSDATTM